MFNENGYLEPGFHDFELEDVNKYFVDKFKDSSTRQDIINGHKEFMEKLNSCGIENLECWIDGSFSTNKTDPNDIDMLFIIDKETLDNVPLDKQNDLSELFNPAIAGMKYKCDAYILPKVDDTHKDYQGYIANRSYWRGFFTFDRKEIPKGIIRLKIEKEVD